MRITTLTQRKMIIVCVNRACGPEVREGGLMLHQIASSPRKERHPQIEKGYKDRDPIDMGSYFPPGKGRFVDLYV